MIVLTYGYAGGRQLQDLLAREPSLACTTSTGILAAVGQAADAWRNADDSGGEQMSALAAASIRQLASTMLTVIAARFGGRRWCETAAAEPTATAAFVRLFPATRIICLHRACPDVARAILAEHPWGLHGLGFPQYLAAYPTSTAAALAARWADQAEPLVEFEAAHPESCLRIRYEDMYSDPAGTLMAIRAFLGLTAASGTAPAATANGISSTGDPGGAGAPTPGAALSPPAALPTPESARAQAEIPGSGVGFPASQLPPALAARVDDLHARLGYPPLTTWAAATPQI